jgi:hypothetical protein
MSQLNNSSNIIATSGAPLTPYSQAGTWTPTATGQTTTGTTTYTAQNGYYTQFGKMIWVVGFVSWTAQTGTGNLILSLPFQSANLTNVQTLGPVVTNGYPLNLTSASMCVQIIGNTATANISQNLSSAAPSLLAVSSGARSIQYTIFYLMA